MSPERVSFRNPRGLNLVGDLYPGGSSAIVVAHGFTGDRHEDGRLDAAARALHRDGYTVVAFDFAGSGESDDDPVTIEGEADDMRGALSFLRDRGAGDVGVLGFSLGAVAAVRAAGDNARTMVFWAPVTASLARPENMYSWEQLHELERTGRITWGKDAGPRRDIVIDGRHLEERRSLDQAELLGRLRCPVLILHGSRDEIVPLDDSRSAATMLPPGSRLKVVRGAGHASNARLGAFIRLTRRWFRRRMPGA